MMKVSAITIGLSRTDDPRGFEGKPFQVDEVVAAIDSVLA